jgi:uncharacterized protein YjbI with pentapeptide repeats
VLLLLPVLLLGVGLGAVMWASDGGDDEATKPRTLAAARATKGATMSVELAVTAGSASWEPYGDDRRGRLVLDDVSPRMAVLAAAPRKLATTVPASFLRAHWEALFGKQESATNAVLAVEPDGDRGQMIPLSVELARAHISGRRFSFDAEALEDVGLKSDALGDEARSLGAATLLVDPMVTDAIKNLWARLAAFFNGEDLSVPDAPIYKDPDKGWVFDSGGEAPGEGVYAGPVGDVITRANWSRLEKGNFDAGGPWRSTFDGPGFSARFTGGSYRGLALFGPRVAGIGFGSIYFTPTSGRVRVVDSALYLTTADELTVLNAEFGGINMRGFDVNRVSITNSVFDRVDMTGAYWGSDGGRSTVATSAFLNVTSDVLAKDPNGNLDDPSGFDLGIKGVDFVSVMFQDSSLRQAHFVESTFRGCDFRNVDFRGAQFQGRAPNENGRTFQPTFAESILDGVSFEGATLENVSFAGVDLSAGNVSFDGATLKAVDFTGAIGLQNVDFSKATIDGPVWGLAPYRANLPGDVDRGLVHSITFDGRIPAVDAPTGFDIDPKGNLIEPTSGVRLRRLRGQAGLHPIDPRTGRVMVDPHDPSQKLSWEPSASGSGIFNPKDQREVFGVDYMTGELIR